MVRFLGANADMQRAKKPKGRGRVALRPAMVWPAVIGCLLGMLGGCQSGGAHAANDTMLASAVRDPILQDIPRPQGFSLDEQRSMAFASGRFRVVRCEYTGKMDAVQVKRFYEQYMPTAHFKLLQWSLEDGMYRLRFESNGELCNIRIRRDGSNSALLIEIAPRPQGSVPAAAGATPPAPRRR